MTRFLLIFFTILSFGEGVAQAELPPRQENGIFPREKYILSLSLLSQLDINNPALQVGLDTKINEWIGIHQELGYINNLLNPIYFFIDKHYSSQDKFKNGIFYSIEPRFYVKKKSGLFASRFFIAHSFNFRYVNIQRQNWFFRYNNSYMQKIKYNINKVILGSMLKIGYTVKLRRARPIQMVFGLGLRYSRKKNNLPEDASELNQGRGFFFSAPTIEGEQLHPDVYFGLLLQLHYFRKKEK